LKRLDVFHRVGGKNKALVIAFEDIPVEDGVLSLKFGRDLPKPIIAAIECIRVGSHLAHAVIGGPYKAVDLNGDNFQNVAVDASGSHTHSEGNVNKLVSWKWKIGEDVIGDGEKTQLNLPVGNTTVTVTVFDNIGSTSTDEATITVEAKGFPAVFSLSPKSGTDQGGTTVTIKGQDIGVATQAVRFGPVLLTSGQFNVIDSATITFITPKSDVAVPVKVSVITARGESNDNTFNFIGANAINFQGNLLTKLANDPTSVVFGPDGRLYVGTQGGVLWRLTLNDDYSAVVDSFSATIDAGRCILGIAVNPMEVPELGDNVAIYISTSKINHGGKLSSSGTTGRGVELPHLQADAKPATHKLFFDR
jgi:IPT/TIG domain